MLNPSMQELMNKVGNRYLLVNIAAQRARHLSEYAEESGERLPDKAVKIALDEIADGKIVYAANPHEEVKVTVRMHGEFAGMVSFDDDMDQDEESGVE